MCPTLEYAISRFTSVCARQASEPATIAISGEAGQVRRDRHGRIGQDGHQDPDQAVAAELQQYAGQQHRADRRRLRVRVGKPDVQRPQRHLHRQPDRDQDRRGQRDAVPAE